MAIATARALVQLQRASPAVSITPRSFSRWWSGKRFTAPSRYSRGVIARNSPVKKMNRA